MKELTKKQAFKLNILNELARKGIRPSEVGASIRSHMEKSAFDVNLPSGWGLAKLLAALGAGAAGTGMGIGYLGERILGPNKTDVDHQRHAANIDALRRAAMRLNAETQALSQGEDEDEKKRRPRRVEIQSAV